MRILHITQMSRLLLDIQGNIGIGGEVGFQRYFEGVVTFGCDEDFGHVALIEEETGGIYFDGGAVVKLNLFSTSCSL